MDFMKGLMSVVFIYAIVWGIFQIGYMRGADSEKNTREIATSMAKHAGKIVGECNSILAGFESVEELK